MSYSNRDINAHNKAVRDLARTVPWGVNPFALADLVVTGLALEKSRIGR